MGDRAQVFIHNGGHAAPVALYTHSAGGTLASTVARALARKQRWNDPEYLARIIFCEMVRGDEAGDVDFGIGTAQHFDLQHDPIHVHSGGGIMDPTEPHVFYNGERFSFERFIDRYASRGRSFYR
jgi:hypothetical protein